MTPANPILQETADQFKAVRGTLMIAAANLHRISANKLYVGQYASFGAYCEEACQISQSFAAKLVQVHEHYAIQGKITPSRLRGIDAEKLYLAKRLPMTPEEQLERAAFWSRSELKAELASKGGEECTHPSSIEICSTCHKRIA